jgi:hypothetical protein
MGVMIVDRVHTDSLEGNIKGSAQVMDAQNFDAHYR